MKRKKLVLKVHRKVLHCDTPVHVCYVLLSWSSLIISSISPSNDLLFLSSPQQLTFYSESLWFLDFT